MTTITTASTHRACLNASSPLSSCKNDDQTGERPYRRSCQLGTDRVTTNLPKCKESRLPGADPVDPEFDILLPRYVVGAEAATRTVLLCCTTPSAVGMQTGGSVRKR